MRVILLAAGKGRRFGARTKSLPKCLIGLDSQGQTLLSRYFDSFRALGLKRIDIVVGHQKEKIKSAAQKYDRDLKIRFIYNKAYRKGSIVSLYSARKGMTEDCLIMDADVYFSSRSLGKLLSSGKRSAFLIDTRSKAGGEEMMLMADRRRPVLISKKVQLGLKILGEATGIFKVSKTDAQKLRKILEQLVGAGIRDVEYEDSYTHLMKNTKVGTVNIGNVFWTEMDFPADLRRIQAQLSE